MAAPRLRNASEMARVLTHGASLYAILMDSVPGTPAHAEAERLWEGWRFIEGERLEAYAKSLQNRAFDIALSL